ncbi:MAG: methylmalonyl-CoA mutase, partial [Frankiales bacterium]|nr:methylmalonyl-CoA mutase [Frankiales bacterium]
MGPGPRRRPWETAQVNESDIKVVPPQEPPLPEVLELAAAFPAATREQWQALVKGVLTKSGKAPEDLAGVERVLSSTSPEGITIAPLYTREDSPAVAGLPGFAPYVRGRRPEGSSGGWDVRARHADPDAAAAHEHVLDDLEHGVTSLWLVLGDAGIDLAALPTVLADVYLDLAAVVLDAGADFGPAA